MKHKDWRTDYIICEHVKKDADEKTLRHQRFRVCCENCYQKGFLFTENLIMKKVKGLVIGKLK